MQIMDSPNPAAGADLVRRAALVRLGFAVLALACLALCPQTSYGWNAHKMKAVPRSDGVMFGTYPRAGSVTPNTVLEDVGMLPMQRVSWDRWSWIETSPGVYDWNQAEFDILRSAHKYGAEAVGSVYMADKIPSFYPQDITNATTRQAAANFVKAYYQQMEQLLGKIYVVIDYEMQWYVFDVKGIDPIEWANWYVFLVNEVKSVLPDAEVICDVIGDNHNYYLPGGWLMVEGFEGYSDDADLRASWDVAFAKDQIYLKNPGYLSNKAMKVEYHNGTSPYWTGVSMTFDTVQDWSNYSDLTCKYIGMYAEDDPQGNSGERLFMRVYDQWGGYLDGPRISNATKTYSWMDYSMDISSWANRSNVQKVEVILEPEDYGAGQIYIDRVRLVGDWLGAAMSVSDALGIDDYAMTPSTIHNDVQWFIDNYAGGKPVYILENGFSTWEGASNKAHGTEEEQAQYFEDVIDDVVTNFTPEVKSYLQFMYPDAGTGDDIEDHWGLVTYNNGREKPALDVVRAACASYPAYNTVTQEDITSAMATGTPKLFTWTSGTEFHFLRFTETVSAGETASAVLSIDFTNDDGTGDYILEANGHWKYFSAPAVDVTPYIVDGTNTFNVYFPQEHWPDKATVRGVSLTLSPKVPSLAPMGAIALVLCLAAAGAIARRRSRL
jgi:hypothetical protein